jgi:hypothetical protein
VEHAFAVGVGRRVTHVDKAAQQLAESKAAFARVAARHVGLVKALDCFLEGLALDEAHGVVGPSVGIPAQAVDGHDSRMLQPACHLRFEQKAHHAVVAAAVLFLNLLERDLAVQFLVERDEHLAETTPTKRPQRAVA